MQQLLDDLMKHRYLGWPLRWLTALTRLSGMRAEMSRQQAQITELQQALAQRQQHKQDLSQQLEQLAVEVKKLQSPVLGQDLPFSVDRGHVQLLQRAEAHLGTPVSALTQAQKQDAFYSYYSEIYGNQRTLLEAHYDVYLDYLPANASAPVLDIGCGAGEFLQYLKRHQIDAVGVDMDPGEVQRCHDQQLKAMCANALEYLPATEQRYAAVTLFQVIEHLEWPVICQLLAHIFEALEPGGCLVMETINLRHPLAFNGFYTDPTHKLPLSDELLSFAMQWAGFEQVQLRYMMPVPVRGSHPDEIERLYYNYAVIGYKPAATNME